jgi:hypothetical protein
MPRLSDIAVMIGLTIGLGAFAWRKSQTESGRGRPRGMPSPEALESGYEPKDMSARSVSYILLTIGIVMMVVIGACFAMVWRFNVARRHAFPDLTSEQTAKTPPPAPHLQIHPFEDLTQLRAREDRALHHWGWTSADHSTAEIPIERAMALMVGKPLDPGP